MSDVFSLFEEEAVNADKFDNVQRRRASDLSNLIRQSIDIDKQIAEAEKFLKDLKFKKRKINEEDIPMLMEEMGMDSVTVDGNKVTLYGSSFTRESQRTSATKRSVGCVPVAKGDIIKNDVTCPSAFWSRQYGWLCRRRPPQSGS